ncbi:XF1762 family protein [Paractinoplanes toevensis]|uniref:XF1762 family protein n=1 Tax=Paractinoplanes toevensis TaxID=571911 RepID=UPI001FED2270|nr:XF1762 family protein [Actinoplanes toevensis]
MPVTFAQASAFITDWHRHHRPPAGHKFSIGAANGDNLLVGVAVVGRPVARLLQDGLTLTATTDIRTCGMPPSGALWRTRIHSGDQLGSRFGTLVAGERATSQTGLLAGGGCAWAHAFAS